MEISTLGILYSAVAMVTLGLAVAIAKNPAAKIGVRRFVFWRQALTSTLLFVFLMAYQKEPQFLSGYFALTLVVAAFTYIALACAYQALKTGKIGILAPIANSSAVITVVFSVFFLGESLKTTQSAAIGVTILGIILLSVNFSDLKNSDIFKKSSDIMLTLAACLIWGVAYALYKIPIATIGPILTAFAIEFGTFLPTVPANIITKTSFALPDKKNFVQIILIGILAATSTLFYNLGIAASGGNVSLVAAITFSNPVISSIYGYFVYKERLSLQQWLALGLTVFGIIGISIA